MAGANLTDELWDPTQYAKFRAERMAPFFDLLSLVEPVEPGARVIDVGCGTGETTAILAERLPGAIVEGIDTSAAMLERAAAHASERLRFRRQDMAAQASFAAYQVVFSNAALQWVPDHEALVPRMLASLPPGAQVAVQVPRNEEHPSHAIAAALVAEAPFRDWLGIPFVRNQSLRLERYAELLFEHGFEAASCFEKVYLHPLARSSDVIEWVKGMLLNPYLARLEGDRLQAFLDAYRARLLAAIGDRAPYPFTFRRLFFRGRKRRP